MPSGTFFTLTVHFPDVAGKETWLAAPLLPNAAALEDAKVTVEDSDLFGETHTIAASSLAAALVALDLPRRRVASSEKLRVDGVPTVRVFTKGTLSRDADAKALLNWARKVAKAGDHHLVIRDRKQGVVVTGVLDGLSGYQLLQPAFLFAAASARAVGGVGRVGFFANAARIEGPVYDTLVADAAGLAAAREEEAQDVRPADLLALAAQFDVDVRALADQHEEWITTFAEKTARMRFAGKTAVIRADGTFLFPPDDLRIGKFASGVAPLERRGAWVYVDPGGRVVVELPGVVEAAALCEGLGRVRKYGTFAFHGPDGAVVIPETRGLAEDFSGGMAVFGSNHDNGVPTGAWGYVDRAGNVVVEPQFTFAQGFSGGRGLVCVGDRYDGGRWGFVDSAGATVIPPRYRSAGAFLEGAAPVQVDDRWGLVDPDGAMRISPRFHEAAFVQDGRIVGKVDSGWGLFTATGEVVVAPEHAGMRNRKGMFVATGKDGSVWFDRDGRRLGGPFAETLGDPGDGLIAVRPVKDGPWGYLSVGGEVVIPPRFHAAFAFGEGHAIVCERPSALAVIDTGGNVVGRFSSERENAGAWAFGPGGLALWGSSTAYGLVAIDGRIVVPPWLDGAEDLGHGWVRVIYSGID